MVACDPFLLSSAPRELDVAVPAGRFPVFESVVEASTEARAQVEVTATVLVAFGGGPITRWRLGTTAGQDLASLEAGTFFGLGVDAGRACFADAAMVAAMFAAHGMDDLELWRGLPHSLDDRPDERERLVDAVHDAMQAFEDDLAARVIDGRLGGGAVEADGAPGNLVMVSAGYGDGVYATWLGHDPAGVLAAAAIDFDVLIDDRPESDDSSARLRQPRGLRGLLSRRR